MQNLSLGVQSFRKLRTQNLIYVDKTKDIYKLVSEGMYYFFSRPRRFGKSLLLNTLKELFLGNQSLFEGLWIEDKIEWESYPVIHLDFSLVSYFTQELRVGILKQLQLIAEEYEIILEETDTKEVLKELIVKLFRKYDKPVVFLVDEYDKPLTDFLENLEQAEENRELIKNFYSPLKGLDDYLKFVFITGVSKFSKVSIFSDLNHLTDLTLHPQFSTIVGYTQAEIAHYFEDRLERISQNQQISKEALLDDLQTHYNGYSWDGKNFVYNPFSVLSFFSNEKIRNYWFSTGTPTFLVKMLQKDFIYDLKKSNVTGFSLDNMSLQKPSLNTLLFQTGYLTIKKEIRENTYHLAYPNAEVEESLLKYLLAEYMRKNASESENIAFQMIEALQENNFILLKETFNALFASIPQDYFLENREKFYAAIMFLTLKILGYFVEVEMNAGRGRLDAIVFFEDKIFVMEFKKDESVEKAIAQIHEKAYYQPYQNQKRAIYLLGFNFISAQKEMEDILVEAL